MNDINGWPGWIAALTRSRPLVHDGATPSAAGLLPESLARQLQWLQAAAAVSAAQRLPGRNIDEKRA